MLQSAIDAVKIFFDGCKDNSAAIDMLETEAEACRKVREGMMKGRRKGDAVLSPQVEIILKIEREREAMGAVRVH